MGTSFPQWVMMEALVFQLLTSKACKRESLQQQKQVDINTDYYVCKKCLCSVLQEDIIL